MSIKILARRENQWGEELICPNCGGQYLHQEKVEVFDAHHVEIFSAKVVTDGDFTMDPTGYRAGVRIHFSCEGGFDGKSDISNCRPVLNMGFNKGIYYMFWDEVCGYEEIKGKV